MIAYSSVFKRVEKKYRIGTAERAAIEVAVEGAMAVDAYGRSRITSLYLDTPDRAIVARSIEKPLYKEKLRLRAYGEAAGTALVAAFGAGPLVREAGGLPLSDAEAEARAAAGLQAARAAVGLQAGRVPGDVTEDVVESVATSDPRAGEVCQGNGLSAGFPVFFGIRKKFKGIVYKRRLALTLPAALAFVSGLPYEQACARWPLRDPVLAVAALSPAMRQIARELEAAMDRWLPLGPSMGITCDRVAWGLRAAASAEDSEGPKDPAGEDDEGPKDPPREDGSLFDPELRITFDDRLEYLDCCRLRASWRPIIAPKESIMEIKSAGPYPPWLVNVLSAERIYPASFTKYGNAYQLAAGTSRIGRGVQTQICSEGRSRKIFSGKMSEKLELLGFG